MKISKVKSEAVIIKEKRQTNVHKPLHIQITD